MREPYHELDVRAKKTAGLVFQCMAHAIRLINGSLSGRLELLKKTHRELLEYFFFNKHSAVHVPLGENSRKRNYFIDGKQSTENFSVTNLRRLSWLGNQCMHKKNTVKSYLEHNQ